MPTMMPMGTGQYDPEHPKVGQKALSRPIPSTLELERAENGGWMVRTHKKNSLGMSGDLVACYTNHADLIAGLNALLRPYGSVGQDNQDTIARPPQHPYPGEGDRR